MTGAQRSAKNRAKKRGEDEAEFLRKQREDRAATRLVFNANLEDDDKEQRRKVANRQVSISCPHICFLLFVVQLHQKVNSK